MVDFADIPDWQLQLAKEKQNFGMTLSPNESKALKSCEVPPLPVWIQEIKDKNPEDFKQKFLSNFRLYRVADYRESYKVNMLFKQAYQKKMLPGFGSDKLEREYKSKARQARFVQATAFGVQALGLVVVNLRYVFPLYPKYGPVNSLIANISAFGTLYYLTRPFVEFFQVREFVLRNQVADTYKDYLLDLHRKNKLIYQFEPYGIEHPVSPFKAYEEEYNLKKNLWEKVHEYQGTIYSDLRGTLVQYPQDIPRHSPNKLV